MAENQEPGTTSTDKGLETRIGDWPSLMDWVSEYDSRVWIFRGVRSADYDLIPTIGRLWPKELGVRYTRGIEEQLLNDFRNWARAHLTAANIPVLNWEWLALGQHHGLPTRFLDWTRSPLFAAYFAVEDLTKERDAAIYGVYTPKYISPEELKADRPFQDRLIQYKEVSIYTPPHFSPRISAQQGLFTVHPIPTEKWVPNKYAKAIIDSGFRDDVKHRLFNLGIHQASLFPDLDGVAKMLKWNYQTGGLMPKPQPRPKPKPKRKAKRKAKS